MKKFVIFILYLIVSLIQFSSGQWIRPISSKEHHNQGSGGHSHTKLPSNLNFGKGRPVPTISFEPVRPTTKAPVRVEKSNDVCAPYNPPLPNFRAPGRRISDVKCYEYIWQLKVREDQSKRSHECFMLNSYPVLAVIGGHATTSGDYPHMGAIGWKAVVGQWKFLCGGSLISFKFLLTAAHCSRASEMDTSIADTVPKIVRLGAKNIADANVHLDVNIIKIIVHPKYKSPKQYYDIALMELSEVVFTENIHPACLWAKQNAGIANQEAVVTGWGITQPGSLSTSPELLAATVDIIDSTKCNNSLRNWCSRKWCGLQDNQICAGKMAGGVDACQGDSGGPLSVKIPLPVATKCKMHFVIGVTSFGIGCALPGLPAVYTRVSSFVDWIEKIVWPE